MSDNYFEQLSRVDISEKIEKKGRFSYLSWAIAVQELGMINPEATWNVKRFEGLPFLKTELGYFVEVEVIVNGLAKTQIHPVLDNSNKPISTPNAFQINTSIQRCLAKAIALHGLGLSIFYGEDVLPELVEEREKANDLLIEKYLTSMLSLIEKEDSAGTRQLWDEMTKPEQDALWKKLNTKEKAVVKKLLYVGNESE